MIHVHWEVTDFCLGQMVCNIQYLTLCLGWGGFLSHIFSRSMQNLQVLALRASANLGASCVYRDAIQPAETGHVPIQKCQPFAKMHLPRATPANVVAGQVYTCPREPRDFGLVVPPVGPKARNVTNKTWAILHPLPVAGHTKNASGVRV